MNTDKAMKGWPRITEASPSHIEDLIFLSRLG